MRAHRSAALSGVGLVPGSAPARPAVQAPWVWWRPKRRGCARAADFQIGIFADPVYHGDWPASVKERAPPNLPTITPELAWPQLQTLASACVL